jgi:L,D-peptidoglycan transpeptidase YkuD (ErfK/YbiS/YcfS/YnhG family)
MRNAEITRGLSAATLLAVAAILLTGGQARAAGPVAAGPVAAGSAGSAAAKSTVAAVPRQLITVTAASYGTTYATLRAYRMSGGKWIEVFGPWTARVGYNGVARPGKKREGDGKTPSGSYGFSFFFGVDAAQHFAFPFRHAYAYDYWDDDQASPRYNEWVDAKTANPGAHPEPMHNVPAYDYAAVIAYNTARVPGLGSAIFLHVGTGGSTAGCVSLPKAELMKVLGWLTPADDPRITIAAV